MASDKQVNELIDAIRESGAPPGRFHDALHDIVFELKAREAAQITRGLHGSLEYILDNMSLRAAKQTIIGMATRR